MPWNEGGAPVMIETLFGLVKDGMQLFAVVWKPFSVKHLRVGKISD
jgi:hypothetical protein